MNSNDHPLYLLTVVLAILGWLLTTYVDRLQKMPLVSYSIEKIEEKESLY